MTNKKIIQGTIKSAFTGFPIADVKINLVDNNEKIIDSTYSGKKGYWSVNVDERISKIIFEKKDYVTKQLSIDNGFPVVIRLLEDSLIGYLDKLWYRPGETLKAFIHSGHPFQAKLIRHGIESKVINILGEYPSVNQNVPNGYFVTDGLSWSQTLDFIIPADLDSGLYSINLNCNNTSQSYSMSFVVAPSLQDCGKSARILVLASTNNWQTYNIWGGRSRYRNFETSQPNKLKSNLRALGLRFVPETIKAFIKKSLGSKAILSIKDHPNSFQFKRLSIKRPHPNCSISDESVENSFTSHLAAGEWRILAWLEREGHKYDLISGFQLNKNPEILSKYDVFILSTHCEYWTKQMFSGLKEFYKNGGSILNLSGNSIYREVEFYEDGSLHCVSLRFSETAEDETKLIGVRFDMRGYGTCAPYKVVNPDHWVFNETNLKKGDVFATKSLNRSMSGKDKDDFNKNPASNPGLAPLTGDGGSGWETDKITQSAPKDITVLAKGTNKLRGGSDMIIREAESGNLMFSASSITFGGSLLIDSSCSILVNNVLKRALGKQS